MKWIAARIDGTLPRGAPVYLLDCQRWISYYLKVLGRESIQLTPDNLDQVQQQYARLRILLDVQEERFRLREFRAIDPTMRIVREFHTGKTYVVLVEIDTRILKQIRPAKRFAF